MEYRNFIRTMQGKPSIQEATVKTSKYSWGTMKTVHHGSDFSIPLHPEHHEAIAKLKDEQEHHFKDETNRQWTARRKGDDIHFQGANNGPKTTVPHKSIAEQAPVAPVPDRKYIRGTPEHKAYKATKKPINGMPTNKVKEETELEEAKAEDRVARADYSVNANGRKVHKIIVDTENSKKELEEVAPPGFEGTVKAMKKHKEIDNPYALAWSMKNKGYQSHKKADGTMKEQTFNDTLHPAGAALLKHIKPEHHNLYKPHLTSDVFTGSYKDRTDVLNAAKKAGHLKEEIALVEAFINHREFASDGLMHPEMAKHMVVGQRMDYYEPKTGDKISGKVVRNNGKEVHMQHASGMHKFPISASAPHQMQEALKGGQKNLDKNKNGKLDAEDFKKLRGEEVNFDDEGNLINSKVSYTDFMEGITTRYGNVTVHKGTRGYGNDPEKLEHEKDDEEDEQPKVKKADTPSRGRGRPTGSKSGARQQNTGKSYSGISFHSLNLPNTTK